MSDTINKTILVESIEDKGKKIVLHHGKEKYGFWKQKQDGSETKAYSQFKSLRVEAGREYPIAVKEEEKSFVNEGGKEITFMERNVMFFATKEAGEGYVTNAPKQEDRMEKMAEWAKGIEKRLSGLETLVTSLTSKQAVDLHQSFKPGEIKIDSVPWTEKEATEHQGDNQETSR